MLEFSILYPAVIKFDKYSSSLLSGNSIYGCESFVSFMISDRMLSKSLRLLAHTSTHAMIVSFISAKDSAIAASLASMAAWAMASASAAARASSSNAVVSVPPMNEPVSGSAPGFSFFPFLISDNLFLSFARGKRWLSKVSREE